MTKILSPDGCSIAVETAGEGPLVVFVHGFPEGRQSWRGQMQALAKEGNTVAALDSRGYGASDKPEDIAAYSTLRHVADIRSVIDALSPDQPAVIVGHDLGALESQYAAILHPDRVRALCMLSVATLEYNQTPPAEFWSTVFPNEFFYQLYFNEPGIAERELEGDLDRFVRVFFHSLSGDRKGDDSVLIQPSGKRDLLSGFEAPRPFPAWLSEGEIAELVAGFSAGGLAGPLNRYRARAVDVKELKPFSDMRILQPTMFVGGSRDPSATMAPGYNTYLNPLSRCMQPRGAYIIEGAGHWIQQEATEQVTTLLLEFLKGLDRR